MNAILNLDPKSLELTISIGCLLLGFIIAAVTFIVGKNAAHVKDARDPSKFTYRTTPVSWIGGGMCLFMGIAVIFIVIGVIGILYPLMVVPLLHHFSLFGF